MVYIINHQITHKIDASLQNKKQNHIFQFLYLGLEDLEMGLSARLQLNGKLSELTIILHLTSIHSK